MSRAAGAVASLDARITAASDAAERLSALGEAIEVVYCYQKYFPERYAKERIRWSETKTVLDACVRFIELASSELFPCHTPWLDYEQVLEDGGSHYIYLEVPWPGWWESEYRAELFQFEQAILLARGCIKKDGDGWEYGEGEALEVNRDELIRLVAEESGPLQYLPTAYDFVMKCTGNIWCDISQEEMNGCGDWPTWNEEAVDFLINEWANAKQIVAKVFDLERWLNERPSHREKVERILRECLATKLPAQAAPLIDQMEDWLSDGDDDEIY